MSGSFDSHKPLSAFSETDLSTSAGSQGRKADASRSTLPAIAAWARSVASGAERPLGAVAECPLELPPVLEPGGVGVARVLKWRAKVYDLGEMLAGERCKCVFLAVGKALGIDPLALLDEVRKQAKAFELHVGAPLVGAAFETLLHGLELAHDALARDHAQMRAIFVWFAHKSLCMATDFKSLCHVGYCRTAAPSLSGATRL